MLYCTIKLNSDIIWLEYLIKIKTIEFRSTRTKGLPLKKENGRIGWRQMMEEVVLGGGVWKPTCNDLNNN